MMKKGVILILTCVICLFFLDFVPVTQATTDHFTDSFVFIIGKSTTVSSTALWLFGFKFIHNRRVIIQANGEAGEIINALILPPKIGFYFGQESIYIQMEGAKGLFFWGEKSLLFQNSSSGIFALCKARDIWITYD
jgi:hypothetical protein